MSNPAFDRWWEEWQARNEALYIEAGRERWAQAHLDFHFSSTNIPTTKENDNEQDHD